MKTAVVAISRGVGTMKRSQVPGRSSRGTAAQRDETLLHLPAGKVIFDSAHPAHRVYLLHSGIVQLSNDNKVILDHLPAGYFFGEKLFLREHSVQTATALSPVILAVYRKTELIDRLQTDRGFAAKIMRNMAVRIDRHEQVICDLVLEQAFTRLARLLIRRLPPRPASGWVRLEINPTNLELVKMIGTTRWRVSHFLNELQRLGCLRRDQGLWIHREALEEFLKAAAR